MMDGINHGAIAGPTAPPTLPRISGFQAALFSSMATGASRIRSRSSFLIMIFHRVLPKWDPLLPGEPSGASFAAQLDLISRFLNVLPLSEAVDRAARNSLPARAACITFDDGYANNLEVAAPLLTARRLPATVFVATSFLGGGRMWNDSIIEAVRCAPRELNLKDVGLPSVATDTVPAKRAAVTAILDGLKYLAPAERVVRADAIAQIAGVPTSQKLMLTEEGVRQLPSHGIEVGAHTLSHPILTRISDEAAREEILGSKRALEDITGHAVTGFAYPNGRPGRDYQRRHVDIVKNAGFAFAVSTSWGCATAAVDRYQLPRVAAWDHTPTRYAGRLIRSYLERGSFE